jgi:hypothetical protein
MDSILGLNLEPTSTARQFAFGNRVEKFLALHLGQAPAKK